MRFDYSPTAFADIRVKITSPTASHDFYEKIPAENKKYVSFDVSVYVLHLTTCQRLSRVLSMNSPMSFQK